VTCVKAKLLKNAKVESDFDDTIYKETVQNDSLCHKKKSDFRKTYLTLRGLLPPEPRFFFARNPKEFATC
jgi:hypothetical protein